MGGASIIPCSLKTKRNQKKFKIGQSFFKFLKSYVYDPLIFAYNRFSKILSIYSGMGMVLCVNLGSKCQNLYPLVSD